MKPNTENERWDLGGPGMCAYNPMEDEEYENDREMVNNYE